MFRLTRDEQIFVVCLLLAVVVGSVVKQARQRYRWSHPIVEATPTPRLKPPYVELDKTPRPPKRIGLEKKTKKAVDAP